MELYFVTNSTSNRSTLRFIGTRDVSGVSSSLFLFSPGMWMCLKTSNNTRNSWLLFVV